MLSLPILPKKLDLSFTTTNFKPPTYFFFNNTFPTTELFYWRNVVFMFKCPLGDRVSKENNAYVGFTTTILSRRLTIHLIGSTYIALDLKTHSIPKSKFRKILVENTTIIAHEINNLRLKILESLHLKTKTPKINRINFKNSDNVLKCLYVFFFVKYSIFFYNILFRFIAFCFWIHQRLNFIQLYVYEILYAIKT